MFVFLDRQTEMDEVVGSLKEKYERDRNLLTDENRRLTSETDRVSTLYESLRKSLRLANE